MITWLLSETRHLIRKARIFDQWIPVTSDKSFSSFESSGAQSYPSSDWRLSSHMSGNLEPRLFESTVLKSDKGCHRQTVPGCLLLLAGMPAGMPEFHFIFSLSFRLQSSLEVKKLIWRQGTQKCLKCIRSYSLSCIIPSKDI